MKYGFFKYSIIILLFIISSVTAHAGGKEDYPVPVFVSIQPLAYFVKRVGGDRIFISVLIPSGKNPATYAPAPPQISGLSKSKIFFITGVPFENNLMPKIKTISGHIRIIDTRSGIRLRKMAGNHHNSKSAGYDPHIWMSPVLVKIQAQTIYDALVSIDPEGKAFYKNNLKLFLEDLERLDTKISSALADVKGETIFVFHPAFGYFTDAYGLKQMSVEIQGKAPKGKNLANFIKKAKNNNVRVIFVQPQFDQNSTKKIADAIGGAVVSIDPLAFDYIKNLEDMADKIKNTLAEH